MKQVRDPQQIDEVSPRVLRAATPEVCGRAIWERPSARRQQVKAGDTIPPAHLHGEDPLESANRRFGST
jgi:hypothetical protein